MLKGRDSCSGNENISDWFWLIWEENKGIFLGLQLFFWLAVTQPHIQYLQTFWELGNPHLSWETHFAQALWMLVPVLVGARDGASLRKALQEKWGKRICGELVEPKEETMRVDFSLSRRGRHKLKLECPAEACTNDTFPFQDHMRGMSHTLSPSLPWRDEVQHRSLQCTRPEIISSGQKALLEAAAISKCQHLEACKEWQSQEPGFEQEKQCQVLYLGMVIAVFVIIIITTQIVVLVGDCAWDQISF